MMIHNFNQKQDVLYESNSLNIYHLTLAFYRLGCKTEGRTSFLSYIGKYIVNIRYTCIRILFVHVIILSSQVQGY